MSDHAFRPGDQVRYRSGFAADLELRVNLCTYVELQPAYELTIDGRHMLGYISVESNLELVEGGAR